MSVGIPVDQILVQTVNGLVNGMILALVASGLTLIFGIMDVVNFAHGDLVMLGGFMGGVTHRGDRQLLARAASSPPSSWRCFGAALQISDAAPAAGPRSAHHHPGHLRRVAGAAELRAVAVGTVGPQAPRSRSPAASTSSILQYPVVPAWPPRLLAGAMIGALWLFLKRGTLRDLDPRHHAGSGHGAGDGHPGAVGATPAVFAIGAGMAAASGVLFGPLVGVNSDHGRSTGC